MQAVSRARSKIAGRARIASIIFALADPVGRHETDDHTEQNRADLVVTQPQRGFAERKRDQPLDQGQPVDVNQTEVDRLWDGKSGTLDRDVDDPAQPRRPGGAHFARRRVAIRVGEDERGHRHRPFGKPLGIGNVEPEIASANLGGDADRQVANDVEPPLAARNQRVGEGARIAADTIHVGRTHDALDNGALTHLIGTIHAEDEIDLAAAIHRPVRRRFGKPS
ncbi:hypothetical protein QP185_21235 [Sphingomonas aerolata]|uniref:hypothetical protein n=1 Tax=Sphingomonas aerolata TaxID=185951 RepID=UPI002FE04C2A